MNMELIRSDFVKTDVSFVKLISDFIFIGNGYYLCIYSRKDNKLKSRIYIFDEQIFGIDVYKNKILLYGGKYLKVYSFDPSLLDFKEISSHLCTDWILLAKFLSSANYTVIVTMHNVVTLLDGSLDIIESKECIERCISYCAHSVNDNWSKLIVLSGTVFNQILLWWPSKSCDKLCPVIYRLIDHKGVIFSIDYNPILNLICTTSDDRTAKIWGIKNESLEKELLQNQIDIELKYTLIGHTARVFKCKLEKDFIVTAGEDGLINIWDVNGELVRKVDVHQGGPVWCLDYCQETNVIVSGGGDSGVFMFKANLPISNSHLENKLDDPRRILILSPDNFIYLTDQGLLLLYKKKCDTVAGICVHDDLKSYGLLEKSPCGNLIALAGYHGSLHLYKVVPRWLDYMYSCQIKSKDRIFSLHWLSCSTLLTCGKDGVLTLWVIGENTMFPIHFWQLPYSKERWSTAACFCGTKNVLVGDRRGVLYLYNTESSQPIQIIKKAHNYLGISALYFRNGKIISLGRNSTINQYQIDDKSQHLTQISSHKVPFTWLAGLYSEQTSGTEFLIGFSGTNFIVYDHIVRRILFEVECGGGHRSWDVQVPNDKLIFSYIKNKRINIIESNLADLRGTDVIKGYHLNEVNALKAIKIDSDRYLFISGGEDTVIRLCSKDFNETLSDFKHLSLLKSHLSSIRTIAVIGAGENSNLIFSGGGRSQIILWELSVDKIGDEVIANCQEKYNYYEKTVDKEQSETRVMDMTTVSMKGGVFLIAGYSDGNVKIFKVDGNKDKMELINHISIYKSRCIFKISILPLNKRYILITAASDGCILFTDITDTFFIYPPPETIRLASIKAHQSGINSLSYWCRLKDELICLTGGDDTAIVLKAFNIISGSDIEIKLLSSFHDESYHGAQVTGAYITEKYFLTTSIDQKLLLFRWNFQDNFNVQCLYVYKSSICDIQGMECCILSTGCIEAFVYGKGCEIVNCKIMDLPN